MEWLNMQKRFVLKSAHVHELSFNSHSIRSGIIKKIHSLFFFPNSAAKYIYRMSILCHILRWHLFSLEKVLKNQKPYFTQNTAWQCLFKTFFWQRPGPKDCEEKLCRSMGDGGQLPRLGRRGACLIKDPCSPGLSLSVSVYSTVYCIHSYPPRED